MHSSLSSEICKCGLFIVNQTLKILIDLRLLLHVQVIDKQLWLQRHQNHRHKPFPKFHGILLRDALLSLEFHPQDEFQV